MLVLVLMDETSCNLTCILLEFLTWLVLFSIDSLDKMKCARVRDIMNDADSADNADTAVNAVIHFLFERVGVDFGNLLSNIFPCNLFSLSSFLNHDLCAYCLCTYLNALEVALLLSA